MSNPLDKMADNAREIGLDYEPALTKILNNPEDFCPSNFDTPERANAFLMGLCQEAATEIERLNKAVADENKPTPADGQLIWVALAFIAFMLTLLTIRSCV